AEDELGFGRNLRPALIQRIEPVERLCHFGRGKSGGDHTGLKGSAVANRVGIVVEVGFEQIQQYVQQGLFHPSSACAIQPARCGTFSDWSREYRPFSAATRPSSSMSNSMDERLDTVNPVRWAKTSMGTGSWPSAASNFR